MFNQVGWGEIIVLLLVGLFVFGPERLPKVAKDAGRMLRELRRMANAARDDIRGELGPEFADLDVRSLHPRAFVQKHLFDEDDADDPLIPPYLTKRAPLEKNPLGLPDVKAFLAGGTAGNGAGSANGASTNGANTNGANTNGGSADAVGARASLRKPPAAVDQNNPSVPPQAAVRDSVASDPAVPFDADAT